MEKWFSYSFSYFLIFLIVFVYDYIDFDLIYVIALVCSLF